MTRHGATVERRVEIRNPRWVLRCLRVFRRNGYEVELLFPAGTQLKHLGYSDRRRGTAMGHIAWFPEDARTSEWTIDHRTYEMDAPQAFARMRWRARCWANRPIPTRHPWGWLPDGRTRVVLVGTRREDLTCE